MVVEIAPIPTIIHHARQNGPFQNSMSSVGPKNKGTRWIHEVAHQGDGNVGTWHGDEKHAHYSLDVFPSDNNFTVGLIAKLLRDLEDPLAKSSRSLFQGGGSTHLYGALL